MSPGDRADYRLTPKALDDLEEIWRYTAETWSIEQADDSVDRLNQAFEMLGKMPAMAREYREINPPVRVHVNQSHLIVYRADENSGTIAVLRVLGGRRDWQAILNAIG